MSKIGRKAIDISGITVDVKGHAVNYKGPHASGTYNLPEELDAKIEGHNLFLIPSNQESSEKESRDLNRVWGLNRALLSNTLLGSKKEFENLLEIVGLGFKAAVAGSKLVFTIGFSHKIDFEIPKGVTIGVDKSGQKLTVKSANKELVGHVCSEIKALRQSEPYKGTGIKLSTDVIKLKAGKAKSAGA